MEGGVGLKADEFQAQEVSCSTEGGLKPFPCSLVKPLAKPHSDLKDDWLDEVTPFAS